MKSSEFTFRPPHFFFIFFNIFLILLFINYFSSYWNSVLGLLALQVFDPFTLSCTSQTEHLKKPVKDFFLDVIFPLYIYLSRSQ